MARLFGKRRVWAALVAASVTVIGGVAVGRGEDPPKVGSTITLPIDGKAERQFKVLTSEKQPDGTYLSELKDIKTGETLTYLTRPADDPPKGKAPGGDPVAPKGKAPTPPVMPDPPKEKDKHPILGRLFGDKDKTSPAAPTGAGANATPKTDAPTDPAKKPGLFARLFGSRKPTEPSMPAATVGPVVKPSSPTPPPVLPVPPGGLSGDKPAFPAPGALPFPNTNPGGTSEPPRVMPARPQPAAPPVPLFPAPEGTAPPAVPAPPVSPMPFVAPPVPPLTPTAPVPVPAPAPVPAPIVIPTPAPVPVPPIATPIPPLPAPGPIPAPPPPGGVELPPIPLPPIPAPPASISAAKPPEAVVPTGYSPAQPARDAAVPPLPVALAPLAVPFPPVGSVTPVPVPPSGPPVARPIQIAVPVGYVPPQVAYDRDIEPFVIALQTMTEPSARLTAARGLADGRHRSTEGVKSVLFRAAQLDPCGEVRAACVTHLCDLGYFTPQFLSHIVTACNDTDPQVREAARAACEKMIRR